MEYLIPSLLIVNTVLLVWLTVYHCAFVRRLRSGESVDRFLEDR